METGIQVLHLDTDRDFLELSTELLEDEDDRISVTTTHETDEALEAVTAGAVDCIVTEYRLQDTTGVEFLQVVRDRNQTVPVILFTGEGSEAVASEAISAGITDYIRKGGVEQFTILANRIVRAVEAHVAQTRVQRREREYRRLVDTAPMPTFVLDADGTLLYLNSAGQEVVGVSDSETLVGESAVDFLHESDREQALERLEQVFSTREPVGPRAYRITDRNGAVRHLRGNIVPVTFDGERAAQLVAVDTTEQRQNRRELERYREAVEAGGDAIYALDTEGYIQMVNQRHVEFAGVPREDLLGAHPTEFMDGPVVEKAVETIRELLDSDERSTAYTFEQERDDGEHRIYENTVSLMQEDGEFIGTVGIIRDITERRQTKRQLERQNDRLDKFASVISHDLRNPLNVAQLRLDLEQRERDSEHLAAVEHAHDRMEGLVENLLQLTRHGSAVSDPEPVDLQRLVRTCWQTTDTANASLETSISARIEGDETRLRRLFENLFRNSVEHGQADREETAVTITVGELADRNGFFVSDDGTGIPAELHDGLFEYGTSSETDGTGFGLAIVREIVDAHGWDITVTESDAGGARFEIDSVSYLPAE